VTAAEVTLDPFWEEKYQAGRVQLYPWDAIVSFVFRHAPRDRARSDVRIVEVGCGTASNLWFAAREGFQVAGIEGSPSAVARARQRFEKDGLSGDLRVGDFTDPLPFADKSFDLAIDRGALTCCGHSAARRTIGELARVLRPGGHFFFNPYSKAHTSAQSGRSGPDGLRHDMTKGTLVSVGQICFYDKNDVSRALGDSWIIHHLDHLVVSDEVTSSPEVHAEWRVIAQLRP
jgi:SAM-dependent methyltransferase